MEVAVPDDTHPQPPAPAAPATPPTVPPLHGPWLAPSLFGPRWPGPVHPAGPAALVAIAVAAVVAAASVPLSRTGIGWLITAIAGVAALVVAGRFGTAQRPGAPRPLVPRSAWPMPRLTAARYGWSAATVALLGVGTVRAAGWLFALCLLTAALTGSFAVVGGRSLRAMLMAAVISPLAAVRAVGWLARGLAAARRSRNGIGSASRILATAAVTVALLLVFGSLFASADENFNRLLQQAVPDIDGYVVARWVFVGALTTAMLGAAAFLRAAPPDLSILERAGTTRVRRLEWTMPLGTLVVLFTAFVAVQLTDMFGGFDHVMDTAGLTFADHARGGFWQLLIVTGLTLAVLAGAARWAPRDSVTDRVLIRVLLGALSLLTLVIVASALYRMDLYADAYGLTPLRLLVALCELWLGAVFVLVLVAGVRLRAVWLPQLAGALAVAALLGLAAANPDALIAERGIERYQRTGRIDTQYLAGLSADAVPALDRLAEPHRSCVLQRIEEQLEHNPDGWRSWNLGRERGRDILADQPVGDTDSCTVQYD
ncbi:MAG TPA: DUF4173 domain-containing protein [Actinoplanes sp.]|nr:DUF4173 domain-containing protein [Actinoplanes sp.]